MDDSIIRRIKQQGNTDCTKNHKNDKIFYDYLNAHFYYTVLHNYQRDEVSALLSFEDPLEVGAACLENCKAESVDICAMLEKIHACSTFPTPIAHEQCAICIEKIK